MHFSSGDQIVSVIIPCLNEERSIGQVVESLRTVLPSSQIYVFDNGSEDDTVNEARNSGAVVRREPQRGKGNVVRRAFADIEADVYVLIDGDDTYDAMKAPTLVRLLLDDQLDMVTGVRRAVREDAYRPGHRWGNVVLTNMARSFFGNRNSDMLSGYRVFSRRFVKSFPVMSSGFEIETELTIHALELGMPLGEVVVDYRERGVGSQSKLHTYQDGARIVRTILTLVKEERPLQFFSACALCLLVAGIVLSVPVLLTFAHTGLVPRFPTAILSASLIILSFLALFSGLILDSVARGRKEAKRLAYLAAGSPIQPIQIPWRSARVRR